MLALAAHRRDADIWCRLIRSNIRRCLLRAAMSAAHAKICRLRVTPMPRVAADVDAEDVSRCAIRAMMLKSWRVDAVRYDGYSATVCHDAALLRDTRCCHDLCPCAAACLPALPRLLHADATCCRRVATPDAADTMLLSPYGADAAARCCWRACRHAASIFSMSPPRLIRATRRCHARVRLLPDARLLPACRMLALRDDMRAMFDVMKML